MTRDLWEFEKLNVGNCHRTRYACFYEPSNIIIILIIKKRCNVDVAVTN